MRAFIITAIASLLILPRVYGQETLSNPHGDIKLDCTTCHNTSDWFDIHPGKDFDHNQTGYPLTGAHRYVDCESCHENPVFAHIGHACADCHQDIHKAEFGSDCENCHSPQSWENRQELFQQHNQTRFPLVGVHSIVDCRACHFTEQRNEFSNTPIECENCHGELFKATLNPDHRKAQFDDRCDECHLLNSSSWERTNYQHTSEFPLRGAHLRADCNSCHQTQFSGIDNTCFACHESDYYAAKEPDHTQGQFSTECSICHTESAWIPAYFDHASSGFPLTGVHASLACVDCHIDGQYSMLPTDCFSCHQADFNGVKDPDHLAANFDHDCTVCHSTTAWTPSSFDHNQTNFPLTGAHTTVNCSDCHSTGYANTPTDCFSCHEDDFNSVNDPDHLAANFDHDCMVCHSTAAWTPSSFDHNQTDFPLVGAHVSVNCAECHSTGYTNTPTDCFPCHESAYDNTTDPNHAAAQFPSTCEDCHSMSAWQPANWDHDGQYFPIYSGKHQNEWNTCADCHVNANDYTHFECITCHEHSNQADLNDKHKEVTDYAYESNACYNCHPTGRAED